jgi:tetratricopeptide (TPR) repeat protein
VEAAAQRQKPPAQKGDPKMVEAKRLFDTGAELYAKGNYEGAIDAWEQSYALSRKALIFESIANAYERLGQPKKAKEYLLKWREAAPAEELELLDTRLKNLDARIAREEQQEAARRADEEKLRDSERGRTDASTPAGATSRDPTPDPKDTEARAFVPGYIMAAVGVGAVIVGVTLDLVAAGRRPDESSACTAAKDKQLCLASEKDGIESSNTLATVGDVIWIAGGVTAVAGVVLAVTLSKPADSAPRSGQRQPRKAALQTSVVPVVSPHVGGLSIRRSF